MKKILYYMACLLPLFWAAGCETLEETYEDYADGGMIRYVGKSSDMNVDAGWEQLRVTWKNNLDASVKKVRVTWKSENDGPFEKILERTTPGEKAGEMDTLYLENLKDALYTVTITNLMGDGKESLSIQANARPYSSSHEDLRSFTRGIVNFYPMVEKGKMAVIVDEDNTNLQELVLHYTDVNGDPQTWDVKKHMTDSLRIYEEAFARDYMFLLPEDETNEYGDFIEEGVPIDFSKPLVLKRKGRLNGCIDDIPFGDETLELDENPIWSAGFSQYMLKTYGPKWEDQVPTLETLELDYNIPTMQELFYFPKLKKVILGKNRYMLDEHITENSSTTDEYKGLVTLQFLKKVRGVQTERYNDHYFGQTDWYSDELNMKAILELSEKIDMDASMWDGDPGVMTEMGSANLDEMPEITPLNSADWKITCSDTLYNGMKKNGCGWLLDDDPETYFEPGQTSGTRIYTVLFDMKTPQKVHGFKVVQWNASPKNDDERKEALAYLLASVKIQFSNDNFLWENATYEEGGISIGNSLGETTFINIPEKLHEVDYRYIRLTFSNRPTSVVDGSVPLYSLRLSDFVPY